MAHPKIKSHENLSNENFANEKRQITVLVHTHPEVNLVKSKSLPPLFMYDIQYWRRCELWLYQGVKSGYILA